MPVPALPEPKITSLMSSSFSLLTWSPLIIAARVTQPVPWTSSLKHGISGLYLSRSLFALLNPKSSLIWISPDLSGNSQECQLTSVCMLEDRASGPIEQMYRRTRHILFLEHEVYVDRDKVRHSTIPHSGPTSAQLSRSRPYYKDRIHTSVPQSSTTGSVLDGCIPAHNVVITNLAIEIRIPPTPDTDPSDQ